MTSRDFCYWLQGYFELSEIPQVDDRGRERAKPAVDFLSEKHLQTIKNHLALVFKHEIDPSYGDKKHQDDLNEIHTGAYSPGQTVPTSNVLMRC
jgi:hypothetical protein